MDSRTCRFLVNACLCLGFLLSLLQWGVKMGFKDHLKAMQSHSAAQKRKKQRFLISKIGLLSLCSPEGLTSHTSDDSRSTLESNFFTQKESLARFASSSSALQRTSLFSKVSPSKFKFSPNKASAYDSHRPTHPVSRALDARPSWRDTQGSILNDAHPEESGWHLVSRRHSLKTPQACLMGTENNLTTVRHPPVYPCESLVTSADTSKIPQPCVAGTAHILHSPVFPCESGATVDDTGTALKLTSFRHHPCTPHDSAPAAADALRIMPCVAGPAHILHPPGSFGESTATAADSGTAHILVALRHPPNSSCDSAATAAAADALVSLNDSGKPAELVDETADAQFSLCKMTNSLVSLHEPCTHIKTMSGACQGRHTLSTMARTGASVMASQLPGLPGSNGEGEVSKSEPVYKQLLESLYPRDIRVKDLESQIAVTRSHLEALQITRKDAFSSKKRHVLDKAEIPTSPAFTPLSKEEEEEVHEALNGANRHQILVQHEPSNIDLSRAALQCLKPEAWLNDEVINLYMELLKERERREQKEYLKCHFFNTFFFNKLYKDARSYDFKAVRRWTTHRKLGYSLLECDKIFVPIHKDIHWCLAVINIREKKLQYLDSLKGHDGNALRVLARYIKDEAKDKGAEDVDTGSWILDYPKDIPEQMNGCDCGMFMIKYADFLSRGNELKFTQEHMEYFRKRTALELLQSKAR